MFFSEKYKLLQIRFIKFLLTGGIAFAIDMAVYFVLTRFGHIPYLMSRTISLSFAIVWNFSVNRYWTFEASEGKASRQVARFLVVILSTSLLSLFLMRVGVTTLHVNDLAVFLAVVPMTTVINFAAHSFWSYADK